MPTPLTAFSVTQRRIAAHQSTPAAFFMLVKAASYFDVTVLEFACGLEIAMDPALLKPVNFRVLMFSEHQVTGNGVLRPFIVPREIEVQRARDFISRAVEGSTR